MTNASQPRSPAARLAPWLVAALAAALALYAFLGPRLGSEETASGAGSESAVADVEPDESLQETYDELAGLARRDGDDPRALGDADAPVVLISYSEFQCPYCGKYARETEPQLIEQYVESGVLRIEWRDFPYLGEESTRAAYAASAAAEQDMFWAYSDALYEDQPAPNSGRVDQAYLIEKAEQAGLDVKRFREQLDDPSHVDRVQADMDEGMGIGVSGTPAFLVNGRPIIGAQPVEVFEQAIEEAAEGAGGTQP